MVQIALDRKHKASRRDDYVGPFQMGLIPPTPRDGGNVKKWSELSAGGKVARTTARTTNFAVILLGAGLSAVLIYALTSELFSKNSSTVLYGEACEMLKASPKLVAYLHKPYVFHNNPPTSVRPRHRNHRVSSQIVVDSSGKEHMLLHFYVQGQSPGSSQAAVEFQSDSDSYMDSAIGWAKGVASAMSEMTYDDLVETVSDRASRTLERAKRMFRFLSGDPVPKPLAPEPTKVAVKEEKKESQWTWTSGFTGLFAGLRTASKAADGRGNSPDGKLYTEGEVHADLVMNDDGYFEFRYLLVDIPNSYQRTPRRIFIERSKNVSENEPVMQWHA
ncbi:hypothetical protein SCP_0109720 [Sparassis crispa]|uniref:Mitochondrial import inner membrane translocase subunit Tim21 n=1 Tax=Sparassis crispa TaxID=139825 RepID=A0A401G7D8_9APHY|nr:hypothetical protein SCP_0109720 [Sparassis crispa]GBE78090.1 hypothetical protein SCP_0109720 [Sparassis crispa]